MSTDNSEDGDNSSEEREKNGRWRRGHSGNPNGRPPEPVRPIMSLQFARDILDVTEADVSIRTVDGQKTVPAITAVLRAMMQRALQGKDHAQGRFIKMHSEAIKTMALHNGKAVDKVEILEKLLREVEDREDSSYGYEGQLKNLKHINKARKQTRIHNTDVMRKDVRKPEGPEIKAYKKWARAQDVNARNSPKKPPPPRDPFEPKVR